MKCAPTTVQGCRTFVQQRRNFVTSNKQLYGYSISSGGEVIYVVWSYGAHWPLHVFARDRWFSNEDKYGVTTSQHYGKSHPLGNTTKLSLRAIKRLVDGDFSVIAAVDEASAA
jgi:hypothetical protein